ncbi:MAG: DUF1559 domain-containing protein, partial [Pirellulaceae bacterium]|nr:DUF1559 domain-containing protein [Pirellulaceae bacterium]
MPFKFNRRLYCEQLEKRRPLALTTPDLVELVSQEETYLGTSPVLQRTLVAPTIAVDAQGGSAYDLRADLPGDQTLRLSSDVTNTHGTQVSRLGERFARVLVDPTSVYEVNYYMNQESWQVVIDAYDQAGTFINRLNLGVSNDPTRDLEGDWHRGFIGRPNDRGSNFIELPIQTRLIEIRYAPALTIGFVGDALDSGPQVVRWRDERSYVSSRTIDLIEADQAVLIEDGKTYTLDASVTHRGSSTGITHSVGYTAYDRDGLQIEPKHVERYGSAFDTRLAADLNPGDTTIDLVNATGWSLESSRPETRSIAWYGYSDSTGTVYADFTYTRHVASNPAYGIWDVGGITGNRINLREPWSGPRLTAGSAVRNTVAGPSLFPVVAQRQAAPILAQATIGGSWTNGFPDPRSFPAGAAMFRPAAELNQTLQIIGNTHLSYRVSTQSVGSVDVDRLSQTRLVTIDVLANDSVAQASGGRLQSVSTPAYGMAQIVTNPASGSQQVRYVSSPNFIGVDRFSYTYINAGGERFTEWVNVASLGGNVDADPALQQAINANQINLTTSSSVDDYGGVSFIAVSGQVLSSRADNHNNLKSLIRNPSTPLSFSLTRGTLHGTLTVNADGTLTYQSEPGFVGIDTFEYAASNGLRATSRIGLINVVANVDEADRRKVGNIALGLLNAEASHRRMFYPPAVPKDANGVPLLSWRVHLLPFLGYASLFNRVRLDEAWNSPNNLPLLNEMPDIFRSAGDDSLSSVTRFLTIQAGQATSPTWHFMHSNGSPRVTQVSQLQHGLSNTLMVVRSGSNRAVPWTKPEDLQFDNANPLATLGGLGEAFLPVAFADSTAVLMPTDVTNSIFTSIATTAPTPGVSAVDGQTLARAWSERLTAPATHIQNYYAQQFKSLKNIGLAMHNY